MSTSAPLSAPLHFSSRSASDDVLAGPSVPTDWRYKWHRTDYPRRRLHKLDDSEDAGETYDDVLYDEIIDRWVTCIAAWSEKGSCDSNPSERASSLQISIEDEHGIDISNDDKTEARRTRHRKLGKRRDAGIAIGTHNGTIWFLTEAMKKQDQKVQSPQDMRAKESNGRPRHHSSSNHLKSPVSSTFAHINGSHEIEGATSSLAETSDVNAIGTATLNSTKVDAEERLETQWHAGKEKHSVMSGMMDVFGLHQQDKHHGHPHTHPHTQNSSQLPSGSSTPASPISKRKTKKELYTPLSPTASTISISAIERPRNGSSATLMDQWEKESTNSDADSQHRHRLSSLMGSTMQRKTSRASYEAPSPADLNRPVDMREDQNQLALEEVEPALVLQPSSSSPLVALTKIHSDQLVSLQEDGSFTVWSLSEARELRSFNVKAGKPSQQEIDLPSSALNTSLNATTTFSTLVGLRSNTNSPAPDGPRTNINPSQSNKAVLDKIINTGISRFHSMQYIADSKEDTPLFLCYDDVKGSVSIVDPNDGKVLSTYSPPLSHDIPPIARMNSEKDAVEIYYINTKNIIMLHNINLTGTGKETTQALEVNNQLSAASALLRREGYSNVPSKAPSITEERPDNVELGNGDIRKDILGMKLLDDFLLSWTHKGIQILRRVGDSLLVIGAIELGKIESVEIEDTCVCVNTSSDFLLYRLSKDFSLVLDKKISIERGSQLQTQAVLNGATVTCTMNSDDVLSLASNDKNVWQGPKEIAKETKIWASLPYSMERIVLSLSSGHLVMSSLTELVTGGIPPISNSMIPHTGSISFLRLVVNPRSQAKHIVGGTEEGDIIFWDAATLQLQSQRSLLTSPVVDMVILGKDDNTLRLNGCLACLGADGSLIMFALDGLNDLYTIPGRGVPLKELAVRTDELLLMYEDGRARVWDMKTLELRRSIGADQAQSLLEDGKGWWSRHVMGPSNMKVESGSAGVLSSIPSSRDVISGTMNANLRRAIEAVSRMVSPSNGITKASSQSQQDDIDESILVSTIEDRMASKASVAVSSNAPNGKKAIQTLRPLLHNLMPFGLEEEIDTICKTILASEGAQMPRWIHTGTSTSNSTLVLGARSSSCASLLSISATVTTIRLLGLTSMLSVLSNISELKTASLKLLGILDNIADIVGLDYKRPCLALLADYINDSVAEIRQAAETLFTTTLEVMPQDEVEELCEKWSHQLPTRNSGAKEANKAVMLLGLVATQRFTDLPPILLKDIANSIALYLHNESEPSRQMEAIFLCDRGFSIFQHYFDAMDVMRTLSSLSVSKQQDNKEEATPAAIEARNLARRATLRVSEENTPLFMTTLTLDILHAQSPAHCNATMRLVALIVRKKPLILYPNLPRLAEAVVKSLDPTVTTMRTVVHRSATIIISELVATYPTIAFHKELQRLAVGTFEGAIIMYDLKTSTRLYVIEAHYSSLSGLSFSQDGRRLVSVCLNDNKVKVWKTGVGFSSFLSFGGAPRQGGLLSVASSSPSSTAMTPNRSNNSILSPKAALETNPSDKSTPPSPNPASSTESGGTNAYKTFEFGRVKEDESTSSTKEETRLDLIKFNWVANRSLKINIGMTDMSFDVN